MNPATRPTLIVFAALFAVIGCLLAAEAEATRIGPKAAVSKKKHNKHRQHRHVKPKPQLEPVVITVFGNMVAVCDVGYCAYDPRVATSVAACPEGFDVVAGGWETFANDAPTEATVTENHPVGTQWIVTMEAKVVTGDPRETHVGHFRAIAQCQGLLRA